MTFREISQIIAGTADAALAIDATGVIVAWNEAATRLFDLTADAVIGQPCHEILRGEDDCGKVCSSDCIVRRAIRDNRQLKNFDVLVPTAQGKRWCNVITIIVPAVNGVTPYSIHVFRQIDTRKRLEMLLNDFVVTRSGLSSEEVKSILQAQPTITGQAVLTPRELEVLRLLANGMKGALIAERLKLKPTTVENHIQHILRKLNAHNRLEAIRRAEKAGIL